MGAEALLSVLEKVRRSGDRQWMACCPAHGDRNPSLSIKETDDGRVLLKCFAGCGAADIVHGVGLSLSALMPESTGDWKSPWWSQQERKARQESETLAMIRAASNEEISMHISIKWFDDRFNFSLHSKPDADEFLTVKGCKIVDGSKGAFVSGPSSKKQDGGYWNHTFMSQKFQERLIEEAEKARPKVRQPQPVLVGGSDPDEEIPFGSRKEPC